MSKEMENNINSNNNTQYFADVTYYWVPPNNKKFKLFTLLALNKEKYHTTLCNLSMIFNENTETFYTLFDYLKNKYNFKTKYITIDFSVAEYYGFKKVFKDIIIIPCFFHFCQNIVSNLPDLKNKNNTIKNYAKDLLTNLKLLCFIERKKVKNFYEEI